MSRILAAVIAVALPLLAACGGETEPDAQPDPTPGVERPTEADLVAALSEETPDWLLPVVECHAAALVESDATDEELADLADDREEHADLLDEYGCDAGSEVTFHSVVDVAQEGREPAEGQQSVADDLGQRLLVGPAQLTGGEVAEATARPHEQGDRWRIDLVFAEDGADGWQALVDQACRTLDNAQIAVVWGGRAISAPVVQPDLCDNPGDTTQIAGDFTSWTARLVASVL
ncbi:MAG: hypothetical protein QM621_01200 [Aeromicrobium sp.]|uniref:SecDF P1 head subdomain-containing protein n=1 Tax=Aeromicrobium sp. TaxID=1871063 RepID=UPI0039E2D1F6